MRERWDELPLERRLQIVDAVVKATEASVERNYERALLAPFDDETPTCANARWTDYSSTKATRF